MQSWMFLAYGDRVTEVFSLQSRGHGVFWPVTNFDPVVAVTIALWQ